jgi:hypothetical protein
MTINGKKYRSLEGVVDVRDGKVFCDGVLQQPVDSPPGVRYASHEVIRGVSDCTIVGDYNIISGSDLTVYGYNNVVEGSDLTVYGHRSNVTGSDARVFGDDCVVTGSDCKLSGLRGKVIGSDSKYHNRRVELSEYPPPPNPAARPTRKRARSPPIVVAAAAAAPPPIDDGDYSEAAQQVSVLCANGPRTRNNLVLEFIKPLPEHSAEKDEAFSETRRLFNWTADHIDEVLKYMMARSQLVCDECGAYSVPPRPEEPPEPKRNKPEEIPDVVAATEMAEDVKAGGEADACVSCLEYKRALLSVECKHLALCFGCARKLIDKKDEEFKCPMCRTPIKRKMLRVFI